MTLDDAVLNLPLDDCAASTAVKDVGPNGLDGVAAANTATKSVAWRGGRALDFNGSTDVVTVPRHASLSTGDGTADSPFSLACWIKVDSYAVTSGNGIWSRSTVLGFGLHKGRLAVSCIDPGSPKWISAYMTTVIPLGEWLSVAATYDASRAKEGLRLWINGVEQTVAYWSSGTYVSMENPDVNFTLGHAANLRGDSIVSTNPWFDGAIQDFRMYDRVLTAIEIRRIYAAGLPADVLADALVEPHQANSGGGFGFGGGFGGHGQWVPTVASLIDGYAFDLHADAATPIVVTGTAGEAVAGEAGDEITSTITYTTGTSSTQWQLRAVTLSDDPLYASTGFVPTITYESGDTGIATVADDGAVTFVSDGTVILAAQSEETDGSPARRATVVITNATTEFETQDEVTYTGGVAGSAREEADDSIDDLIAIGQDTDIFTSQDHDEATYVRNASCWAASLDFTGVSVASKEGAGAWRGTFPLTLISERHAVLATHVSNYLPVGATVRFVDDENTAVDVTILGKQQVSGDLTVAVLSEAVTGCGFASVLPANHVDYFPTAGIRCPVIGLDQEEKALVRDLNDLAYEDGYTQVRCQVPTDATRLLCYESLVSGDSSSPCFMVIDGDLVLLCVWTYGGAGRGTAIHEYLTELNAAMASLDTAHGYTTDVTATEVDLSGYTDFSE